MCKNSHCQFDPEGLFASSSIHISVLYICILQNLALVDLLEIAQQVCDAMTYLEGIHVVHGNLAARNCL